MGIVTYVVPFVRAMLASRARIAAESLAPRQQPGVLQASVSVTRLLRMPAPLICRTAFQYCTYNSGRWDSNPRRPAWEFGARRASDYGAWT
jgi:hypothetical protein